MTNSPMQLALREWRQEMSSRSLLLVLLAVGIVLTIAAPFNTDSNLAIGPRAAYWIALSFCGYSAGLAVNLLANHFLPNMALWPRATVAALMCTAAILVLVTVLNLMFLQWSPQPSEWPVFLGSVFAICLVVNFSMVFVGTQNAARDDSEIKTPERATTVPLMERLTLEKRGALRALTVEDHYTRVRTSKGEELILMRLSDAIREVGNTDGGQIHRSHWVAWDAVVSARREGDRAIVTLPDDVELPVSRANVPKLKEAGLLPR